MHPAASIIVFTALSGAGFGLVAFLSLGFLGSDRAILLTGAVAAMVMTTVGLLASTFHLGNPQRAWRALSQWRSSWLSREGILAVVTLIVFATFAYYWIEKDQNFEEVGNGIAVLAMLTVFATAMIYASLKTVPLWHTVLTPVCYMLFGAAGGGLVAALIVAVMGEIDHNLTRTTLFLLIAAWSAKSAWWARASRMRFAVSGHSPESATGLGELGRVRLLEAPHTSPNYLMREMVHRIGRKHAQKLRLIAIILGAVVPLVLLFLALAFDPLAYDPFAFAYLAYGQGWMFLLVATISHFIGVLAERWLFFAEAKHVVSLYYGYR